MPAPPKSLEDALALIKSDNTKVLDLTFGEHKITPGQVIPRAYAQAAPQLAFGVPPSGTYIVICLDIDAPFPSFPLLGPALHWIQPGLKADSTTKLTASEPFVANYAGPAPPPGSAPHRYVFMLYEQPADFDAKKYAPAGGKNMGIGGRMRYNLDAFEEKTKLGPAIAANYFCSK